MTSGPHKCRQCGKPVKGERNRVCTRCENAEISDARIAELYPPHYTPRLPFGTRREPKNAKEQV